MDEKGWDRTFQKRVPQYLCRQVSIQPGEEIQQHGSSRKVFVPYEWWIIENPQSGHMDTMPPHQFEQVYRESPTTASEVETITMAAIVHYIDDVLKAHAAPNQSKIPDLGEWRGDTLEN